MAAKFDFMARLAERSPTFARLADVSRLARLLTLERLCNATANDELAMLGDQYRDMAGEVRAVLDGIL